MGVVGSLAQPESADLLRPERGVVFTLEQLFRCWQPIADQESQQDPDRSLRLTTPTCVVVYVRAPNRYEHLQQHAWPTLRTFHVSCRARHLFVVSVVTVRNSAGSSFSALLSATFACSVPAAVWR